MVADKITLQKIMNGFAPPAPSKAIFNENTPTFVMPQAKAKAVAQ